jgi:hypothetical protein
MGDTDNNQPIWRYMRLETLLRLLHAGTIFLPTLATLKSDDPNEGEIVRRASPQDSEVEQLELESPWLIQQANAFERELVTGEFRTRVLREIWLRELSKRRLVWCWHAAGSESMAQWQIYAHKGVAIRSTPAAVVEALQAANVFRPQPFVVRYLSDSEHPSSEQALNRPFIFKRASYGFEKEIRFVMMCRSLEQQKGVNLSGVLTDFIEEIVVSPFCVEDEAYDLAELLRRFFPKKERPPLIHRSSQRSSPTTSTFLDELLDLPDELAIEAAEANVPSLFRQL